MASHMRKPGACLAGARRAEAGAAVQDLNGYYTHLVHKMNERPRHQAIVFKL